MKFIHTLFACLLLFSSSQSALAYVNTSVPMDYPGLALFGQDQNLPGHPDPDDIQAYKNELIRWGKLNKLPITPAIANEVINQAMNPGFTESPTYSYVDKNGVTQTETYYDINRQKIWHNMRDLLFLESMIASVEHWEENYINPLATGSISLSAAYDRAKQIYDELIAYQTDSASNSHSPFISAIIGNGDTSYGNFFKSDGVKEAFIEGKAIEALEWGASGLTSGHWGTFDLVGGIVSSETLAGFAIEFYGKNGGDPGTKATMQMVSTGTFGVLNGGLGLIMAPGTIIYTALNHIGSSFSKLSKGSLLVNYYYLSKYWPDELQRILEPDATLDYYTYNIGDWYNIEAANDPIAVALSRHDYRLAHSADYQAQTIYGMATALLMASGLDIEHLKKELVSYAYLQYLKKHEFVLTPTRLSDLGNVFDLTLPDDARFNPDHGSPQSISWYWASEGSSSYSYLLSGTYETAISNQLPDADSPIYSLNLDLNGATGLNKNIQVKVNLSYPDGFTSSAQVNLKYLPQHNTITLEGPWANQMMLYDSYTNPDNASLTVNIDGDEVKELYLYTRKYSGTTSR
ncbi:hypothetical protein, partial [Candidatus Venteria ishoeyi]|uniref:hypothetical protein n=1 Tax=Candidatus Venteria ishoeyi TaxID=1899563 RepID=UPI0011B0034D